MISEQKEVVRWIKPIEYQGVLTDWANDIGNFMEHKIRIMITISYLQNE